ANNMSMLVVFIKSILVYLVLLFVIRLMGKRQLGEMQPFELVITLIIAEVACIPLNDPYLPLHYGLIPTLCLTIIHILFSFIARFSLRWRRAMSGSAVIAIDTEGINYKNLTLMNMNVTDLLEAIRCSGSPDINTIKYAVFETNGQICIVEKSGKDGQAGDYLPMALIIDGKVDTRALQVVGVTTQQLQNLLARNGFKVKSIALLDVRQNGEVFVSPKQGKSFVGKISVQNQW
ncbi:MAG: DUF421 domain-containing protein, partial [Firmicutes bacterium]|nr:DUF421 domain-containing protein [Bacillota bacterium]